MRVQLITHSYLPERTPPERRWSALTAAFRGAGWAVDVICPPPDPHHTPSRDAARQGPLPRTGPGGERVRRTWMPSGLPTTRAGRFAGHIVNAVAAIPVGLAAPRPDVIVVTIPALPSAVAGWTLSRLRRVPLIVEMRDAWPDLARESGVRGGVLSKTMESVVTGTQRSAEAVVTVTAGFAERLRQRGIATVVTIGNGVAVESIPAVPRRVRGHGELNVLYLGNHGESQGLENVIRAAALVRGGPERIRVRMVGRGTRHGELVELNESLGYPVEMLDSAFGAQLQEQYAWADTCVVALRPDWPSFEMTIPSKTYELLAVGRHITGVVTGEAARLLEDTGSADVVPADPGAVAELWRRLAADPDSTDVGVRGRRWLSAHADLPLLGARFVQLAEAVVAGRVPAKL
ncbi:glycosyltransferase family 4 protein [Microbacterium sp. A93]|uniref:glycosyltransferase family 4 protein n=1 Tax=Microbacterium sp. A93 TaxID=3450716 RepID=UPI003F43FDC6